MLTGCYETQLPIVTAGNAHSSPVIADGQYCEVVFKAVNVKGQNPTIQLVPERRDNRCFTLTWIPDARGWRTDLDNLGTDELGVSIRARKLGHGSDAVGLSRFFMIQAGAPPRQITVAGRSLTVSTAQLLSVFAGKDMFAIIGRSLPSTGVAARAKRNKIPLLQASNGLTIPYLSQLGSNPADTVGHWLAWEITHEVLAAQLPDLVPEKNAIRIFARIDDTTRRPGEFRDHIHSLLESMLSEASTLNAALALDLPPANMDLSALKM